MTDANGDYRFAQVARDTELDLRAELNGYVPSTRQVAISTRAEQRIDIELEPGLVQSFVVLDGESGLAVEGALVSDRPFSSFRGGLRGDPLAVSDAQGRFSLRASADAGQRVYVHADGYCMLQRTWDAQPDQASIELRLVKHAWIHGVVRDVSGVSLDHFEVSAICTEHRNDVHWALQPTTDQGWSMLPLGLEAQKEHGGFSLAVVPCSAPYRLLARARGYASETVEVLLPLPGAERWIDVMLRKGGIVRGRVECAGSFLPGSGAEVSWRSANDELSVNASFFEDGTYEARDVRPGQVEIFLVGGGGDRLAAAWVDVTSGTEIEQDLVCSMEMGAISGRVAGSDGNPVPAIVISAICNSFDRYRKFSSETAEDGTYSLQVERGLLYEVSADLPLSSSHYGVEAGANSVNFERLDLGEITLRLVDAETGEIVPTRLEAFDVLFQWRRPGMASFSQLEASSEAERELREDRTLSLPLGSVELLIHLREKGYAPALVRGITVLPGAQDPLVVELSRGIEAHFVFSAEASQSSAVAEPWWEGHLLFVLEESELGSVTGPYAQANPSANMLVQGIYLRVENPGLIRQAILPRADRASVQGLAPGRYSIVSFPDDFVFEPAAFALDHGSESPIAIRWRSRR